jgi:hypothetical protein
MAKNRLLQIAEWTEKVNSTASQDPLGLSNRVSQRLVNNLLFGITALGYRARYYSYYTWSIYDVINREKPANSQELADGIYWRDKTFTLACLLHHENDDYSISHVEGVREAKPFLLASKKNIKLIDLKHIHSNKEGGFGLNYKGSLIGIGFIKPISFDEDQQDSTYKINDDQNIQEMIHSLNNVIKETSFYKDYACKRKSIPIEVIKELGDRICLCKLKEPSAPERNILRDIIFERKSNYSCLSSYRPQSLRWMLKCAHICSKRQLEFNEWQFRIMSYYEATFDKSKQLFSSISDIEDYQEIKSRWGIFFLHYYFSVALEKILGSVLELLCQNSNHFLHFDKLIKLIKKPEFSKVFNQYLKMKDFDFNKTNVKNILDHIATNDNLTVYKNSEEDLRDIIMDNKSFSSIGQIAISILLLLKLYLRCQKLEATKFINWYLNASHEDADRNMSCIVMYLKINQKFQDLKTTTLQTFIEYILKRFIIEQHEIMVPDKKEGTAWLTYDNNIIYFENHHERPSPGSSRFEATKQVICDFGLLDFDENEIPVILPFSEKILSEI